MTADPVLTKSQWWHPDQFAQRKGNLEARQRVIASLRAYFAEQDFAEVQTPSLQISPGGEVHVQAFATELRDARGGAAQRLYLHTSPEFAMKKLLVAGMPRLYQLAHCFRNGERSSLHHPEFLMLEWYRAKADLAAIMQDCVTLVRAAAKASSRAIFSFNGLDCDPFKEWKTLTVPEAFRCYAGMDLLATAPEPRAPDAKLLAKEAKRIGVRAGAGDTWDDLFFRILGEKIESHLGKGQPTFLCDYPVSMAALARPKESDPRLAERMELYICGVELANGFFELTDADEQARRLKADMALKEKLYGTSWPVDEDFIAALRFGMPDAAGIALGVDRLIMLCAGAAHIEDVLWMPVAS
jgi:lysyl-tRNA synthetase class 2